MKSLKFLFGMVAVAAMLLWACANKAKEEAAMAVENVDFSELSYDSKTIEAEYINSDVQREAENSKEAKAEEEYAPETYISSSAAVENPNDTARKMIRTAHLKFKVKDVIKSTYEIENIIAQQGGFVQHTNLTSAINSSIETPLTKDTALLATRYYLLNEMVLRVPNTKLDATLKEIARLVDFMDCRVIDAQDVTLDLLAKRLEQARLARYDKRMSNAIGSKGKKLNDITDAEDNLLYKQMHADEAKLAALTTLNRIRFSTINISLYQNQSIKYERVARETEIKPYSEPFSTRFCSALSLGWKIIVEIVLFLTNLWAIILLGITICISIIYIKKKRGK